MNPSTRGTQKEVILCQTEVSPVYMRKYQSRQGYLVSLCLKERKGEKEMGRCDHPVSAHRRNLSQTPKPTEKYKRNN